MSEKIYCGNAKIVNTQYGDMTKILLHKDDVNKIVKYMKANDSDFINIDIKEKQNKVEGKSTHYLEVDQWKPTPQTEETPPPLTKDDDLPF